MSNRAVLIATTFTDITGEVSYGFRIYDNDGSAYSNTFETLIVDDVELLREAAGLDDDAVDGIIEFACSVGGLEINGTHYSPDELKKILRYGEFHDR